MDIAIDKSKKKFLDKGINHYIGRDDSFWWIVIIGDDVKNPKMLKITGKARPNFKGSKCSSSKSLILSVTGNKSSRYLFFNLEGF